MTPKPANQSIMSPCAMQYENEFCDGIAALIRNQYECQTCAATWNLDGTPNEPGKQQWI